MSIVCQCSTCTTCMYNKTYQCREVCGDELEEGVCPPHKIVQQSHPSRGPTRRHRQTFALAGSAPVGKRKRE